MARLAYLRGRIWDDPAQVWGALQAGTTVSAVYFPVDMDQARVKLAQLSSELSTPMVNASVAIENGAAVGVPARAGRTLDVEATLAQWRGGLGTVLRERVLDLVFYPVAPTVTDVSALVGEINARLATPLTVRAYDPVRDERFEWPVSAETWVNWLTFDVVNNAVTWQVDAAAVVDFIAEKDGQLDGQRYLLDADASTIGRAIENGQTTVQLRIYHAPTTHLVQSGETLSSIGYSYGIPYPWLQEANPGVEFLTVGQAITVPSPDEFLPLPVVENKRVLISLSQQRMWGYENGALVWDQTISTGIEDSPTHPGVFQVQSHEREAYANAWDLYMPYFMGIYQPGPNAGVMNGFHGFPTRDGYNLLWTNNLGTPVTYGCVLINNTIAPAFYAWAEEGVVVEIVP
jgi:lipoprotein-anchoring transpeptidase ErfK/SrfK